MNEVGLSEGFRPCATRIQTGVQKCNSEPRGTREPARLGHGTLVQILSRCTACGFRDTQASDEKVFGLGRAWAISEGPTQVFQV